MTNSAAPPATVCLGAHVSIAGGLDKAFDNGEELGCDCLQIFTRSSRQWKAAPIRDEDAAAFRDRHAASTIGPVIVHTSYLINVSAVNPATRAKSLAALEDEVRRADQLGCPMVVLHPGSHGGEGEEAGLAAVSESLRQVIDATAASPVRIALETTAGQGTNLGHRFEHIARLYERVDAPDRLAVCIDSCHLLAAGYEIRTREGYDRAIAEFDRTIGLDRLRFIHLNDSKTDLGSHVDRHEHIGEGNLGLEPFRFILNDPRLVHIPMCIETPKGKTRKEDKELDLRNLAALRALIEQPAGQATVDRR